MANASEPAVLLVMPPQKGLLDGFATGLMCLHSHLARVCPNTFCELVDLSRAGESEIAREFRRGGDRVRAEIPLVGITTTTASYQQALCCARIAKATLVQCKVVFGGPHAGADPENVLRYHSDIVDYVVVGEGERPLELLVKNHPHPSCVPGLAYLDQQGRYVANPLPPLLGEDELDKLDVLYRGGFLGTSGKFATTTYVSARGCPLKCAFCSVANQKIRARSLPQIKKDIRRLVAGGYRRISIEDNFFAHAPARTKAICQAFCELRSDEGLEFTWDCQTRVESMSRPDMAKMLGDAGCFAVYLGVESLIPDQLTYLNKTRHPDSYLTQLDEQVLPQLLESGVDAHLNLQFGFPSETDRHYDETLRHLARLGALAQESNRTITVFPQLHVVYPGTQHFNHGVESKQFMSDVFEGFTTWEAQQEPVLNWLGVHFAHGTGGIPVGILDDGALANNQFAIRLENVLRISTNLTRCEALPGIRLFKYGEHLTNPIHLENAFN